MPTLIVHTDRGCARDEFDQSYVRFNLSFSREVCQPAIAKPNSLLFPFLCQETLRKLSTLKISVEAYQSLREANLFSIFSDNPIRLLFMCFIPTGWGP